MNTRRSPNLACRPVFIGGLMKSGTSLLRVLMGQHPELFASFETHWYSQELRVSWASSQNERVRLIKRFFELSEDEYCRLCEMMAANPGREFLDALMEYCCARAGKPRWIEKTPGNISCWKTILECWPDALLIHVTREYKDCYASWKVRRGDSLNQFLESAKGAYNDIRDLLGTQTENYLEIDYNELVSSTHSAVFKALAHVGVPWHDDCAELKTEDTSAERRRIVEVLGRESSTALSLERPVFTDSIHQWRQLLSEDESKRIDLELSEYYEIFKNKWDK